MSESKQPFTEHVTRSKSVVNASHAGWIVAVLLGLVTIFFVMLWAETRTQQQTQLKKLQAKLDDTTASLADALAASQTNQDLNANLTSKIADLEQDKATAAQMSKGLENEMRSDLESKDVTISKLQGKLTVNILDRIMYDSGEAVLKPDGQAVLRKVAAILAGHPELKIHVIGHTDNVPIRLSAHSRFASNWELSTARALAAVHFLTEQAGVDPRRVGAVGYGEYRPIADNSTAEGRAKNRRIAITILPDELVGGVDTSATPNPNVDTNSPPVVPTTNAPVLPPQ